MDQLMKTKRANVVIVVMTLQHSYNADVDRDGDDDLDDGKASGREVLASTLSSFMETGDSVIALHVNSHPSASDTASRRQNRLEPKQGNAKSIGNASIYQSICKIKKVDLRVKVVEDGPSLKMTVVEEARKTKASKVILGYGRAKAHLSPLQHLPPVSFAKFCSKKLPCSCSVIVIQEERVAFQKEGVMKKQYDDHDDDDDSQMLISIKRTIRNHAMKARNKIIPHVDYITKRKAHTPLWLQLDDPRKHSRISVPLMQFLDTSALALNLCPSQGHQITSKKMSEKAHRRVHCLPECINSNNRHGNRFGLYHVGSLDSLSRACSRTGEENSHSVGGPVQVGWPLLRRCSTMNDDCQMSVVEWALHLPDRPKEKLNGQYRRLPCKFEDRCTPTKDTTNTIVKDILGTTTHPICNNTNTVWPRLELLIHERKICYREFHLLELQAATCNFSTSNMIGKGGCSKVYQGTLLNGKSVAVKCISASSTDAEDEFITEVEIVGSLQHRHVIQLFGYCIGPEDYFLVYNFASEGNLENKLHGHGDSKAILPWEVRYKVAIGIAEALTYLHDNGTHPVIHRDVKSSNILLDSTLTAQLTDFGLAKWAPTSSSHITCSDVVGTFGYLAPEYFMFGRVSEKTDVFSFGVVLLELVTGRRPIDNGCAKGEENLVVWARPFLDDCRNFSLLVDIKLGENYNDAQLKNMVIAAAHCLKQSPQRRPKMNRIHDILLNGESQDLEYTTNVRHDSRCKESVDDIGYDIPSSYGREYTRSIQKHLTLALLDLEDASSYDEGSMNHIIDLSHSNINDLEEYSR